MGDGLCMNFEKLQFPATSLTWHPRWRLSRVDGNDDDVVIRRWWPRSHAHSYTAVPEIKPKEQGMVERGRENLG